MATSLPPPASVDIMMEMLQSDPGKVQQISASADPMKEIEKIANEAKTKSTAQNKEFQASFMGDKRIYRVAIYVLGVLAILSALGALILAGLKVPMPESVIALGATSVGALVGLFADKPTS